MTCEGRNSGALLRVNNGAKLCNQSWKIIFHDVPKDVEIDNVVPVDQAVSQANDVGPRNVRITIAGFRGKSGRRFANDFQQPDQRQVQQTIAVEVRAVRPPASAAASMA